MAKSKSGTFTFETDGDFADTFEQFKKVAAKRERSVAAMIRILIKDYLEKVEVAK